MPTFSQEPLVLQDTHYARKKISSTFKKWKEGICAHTSVLCCFFFLTPIQRLCNHQNCEVFFSLSEIIKRSLNYQLMVILPAMCRLQNPITTLMKSISSWPQPLYTWTVAFIRWLYGCGKKVTTQGQSRNPGAGIPPKHFTGNIAGWGLQRMEWLIKETFKMSF